MALPVDRLTQVYSQIWTLLLADSDFAAAVKEANRIRYDIERPGPIKPNKIDSDFPEAELREGQIVDPLFPKTFGNCSVPRDVLVTFELRLTHQTQRLGVSSGKIGANVLKLLCSRALAAQGSRLGLDFVKGVAPLAMTDATVTTIAPGTAAGATGNPRLLTTIRIPVTIRI